MRFHDELPPKKNDIALCVIPANEYANEQIKETRESLVAYAKKCNADYIELSGDQCEEWPMANKYRLYQVTTKYKKTLYVDCDVVIKKESPDIFKLTPDDKISAFNELDIHPKKSWIKEEQETVYFKMKLSSTECAFGAKMLNGGVMVIPQSLADYYKQPNEPYPKLWCFDQHLLTLTLPEDKFFNLDEKFNTEYISREFWLKLEKGYFIHINGCKDMHFRKTLIKRIYDNVLCEVEPTDFIIGGTFLLTANLVDRAIQLCEKLPLIKGVIGLPRSGLIPASAISITLSLPLYSLSGGKICKLHSRSKDGGSRMSEFKKGDKNLPFLVVDDTSYSGAELVRTKQLLEKEYPEEKFIYTTIYSDPSIEFKSHSDGKPLLDIVNARAHFPHVLEWNFFNAHTTLYGLFDLDGVFCKDCPPDIAEDEKLYERWISEVEPLKSRTPSLFPCMAICTGRLEKYRVQTERWLKKHGIKHNDLIMFDGTKEDRDRDHVNVVSNYKSKVFNKYTGEVFGCKERPIYFTESCPLQSRLIASTKDKFQFVVSMSEKKSY
jgi:hypothetical protein